jgi:cation diffusion facilitator CzcD-associated flavoprotein CzcO
MVHAGSSYRRPFYILRFKPCRAEPWIWATLQISYLKSMIFRLSVAALHKYKLAVSGHKNRRSFQVSYRKEFETDKQDADLSLRRVFYCVWSPVKQNHEFAPLYEIHLQNLRTTGFLLMRYSSINRQFVDMKIAGIPSGGIEKNLRLT